MELIEAPHRFLAGEESALASRTSGGPALPRFKPPRVSQRGVAGRRTLVQNVETLAHMALIARYGPGWFRSAGTADEPGSMLGTLHQADGRTGVVETKLGTPIADLLRLPAQAVLIGGYHGAWLPGAQAERLPLGQRGAPAARRGRRGRRAGGPARRPLRARRDRPGRPLSGAGVGRPVRAVLQRPAAHGGRPGRAGQPAARAPASRDLHRWSGLVAGRGACHHPDGTIRFVRSALQVFAAEIDQPRGRACWTGTSEPFLPLPADTRSTTRTGTETAGRTEIRASAESGPALTLRKRR